MKIIITTARGLIERVALEKSPTLDIKWIGSPLKTVESWLAQYFTRSMPTFLPPLDDSQFVSSKQREILLKLTEIPFGTTVSYKNLAEKVGWKKAHRAVGTLIGRNPFPLFLPCHRVICSDGSLGGFFFDLSLKSELLTFESL